MYSIFCGITRPASLNVIERYTAVSRQMFCSSCIRRKTQSSIGRKVILRKQKSDVGAAGYFLLIIPVATFGLGTWQVQRRKWKLNLIEQLEQIVLTAPVPFPENLDELEDLEYRRVRVRGTFDHSKELYVNPRILMEQSSSGGGSLISSQAKVGCHVITPLKLADRSLTILVNRGWVPKQYKNPAKRSQGQVDGEIEFVGVVRKTEKRSPFGSKNIPEMGQWCHRDIDAMARILGTSPVFIDADQSSTIPGGPVGGQTRLSLRNEHASYIATWYSLSILTAIGWYMRFFR